MQRNETGQRYSVALFVYLSRKLTKFNECLPRREIGVKGKVYPGTEGALAAEPGGEVRNRSKGANCLSAASAGWSSQPAARLAAPAGRLCLVDATGSVKWIWIEMDEKENESVPFFEEVGCRFFFGYVNPET